MLRTLYIEAGSGSGGSSASLLRLITHMDRRHVEPFVLVHQRGGFTQLLESAGVWVEQLTIRRADPVPSEAPWQEEPSRLLQNLFTLHGPVFRQVVRWIRALRPDVLHVNNSPRVGLAAIAAARWCRVPVVCHLRTTRALEPLELRLMRWIDRLVVLSSMAKRLCLAQGIDPSKVVQIPNGIDVTTVRNGHSRATARQRFGWTEAQPVIGVVARLIPGKGHEVFLRAMQQVVTAHPEARAVIVGDVCEGASEHPQRMKQLTSQLGLADHVRFVAWSDDVAEWYPAFDVVAQTSLLHEGLPGVCLEAMAHELPIVSTAVGGALDVIEDGRTGRLVPPGEPQAMADAVLDLLSHPAERRQMGLAGYQRVAAQFDIRQTAHALEAVYHSLASRKRPCGS